MFLQINNLKTLCTYRPRLLGCCTPFRYYLSSSRNPTKICIVCCICPFCLPTQDLCEIIIIILLGVHSNTRTPETNEQYLLYHLDKNVQFSKVSQTYFRNCSPLPSTFSQAPINIEASKPPTSIEHCTVFALICNFSADFPFIGTFPFLLA